MSKNTSSNAFRRIDVDQYAEDNYKVSYNCSLLVNLRFCSQIFNSSLNLKKKYAKIRVISFLSQFESVQENNFLHDHLLFIKIIIYFWAERCG